MTENPIYSPLQLFIKVFNSILKIFKILLDTFICL